MATKKYPKQKIFSSSSFVVLNPGWKKSGSGINIPDPQHCKINEFTTFDARK
jgi:hypothetical protein